jgi:hypothetical protein
MSYEKVIQDLMDKHKESGDPRRMTVTGRLVDDDLEFKNLFQEQLRAYQGIFTREVNSNIKDTKAINVDFETQGNVYMTPDFSALEIRLMEELRGKTKITAIIDDAHYVAAEAFNKVAKSFQAHQKPERRKLSAKEKESRKAKNKATKHARKKNR